MCGNARKAILSRAGTPEDIAYAAVYLASGGRPHTAGENLVVDTGITLG
ncbi:MAG: SDR family oxidoreductase [Dehalococcoidia bacterium]|nr:SDR family oxidoreductase [Dehalococcoidia bacterium]